MISKGNISSVLLTFLISVSVAAADSWLCTEEASQRNGKTVRACGIGIGADESAARLKAFDNAKREFERICQISNDCAGRMISVEPRRTTCDAYESDFKCYRLLVFTIGEVFNKKPTRSYASANPKYLEPFIYGQTAQARFPKVYEGQSKSEFLQLFGKPDAVMRGYNSNPEWLTTLAYYKSPFCNAGGCSVEINTDVGLLGALAQIATLGLVNYVADVHLNNIYRYTNFRVDYTEELK